MSITAELQLTTDHFLGGQTLDGTVRVDSSGPTAYTDLRVRLCWRKQVGDEVESECVAETSLEVPEEADAAGQAGLQQSFELTLPHGPYSFETPHTSLSWTLEAHVTAHGHTATDARTIVLAAPDSHADSARDARNDPDLELDGCWTVLAPIMRMPDTPEEKAEGLQDVRLGAAPIKKTSGMGCFVLFAAFILILILVGGFNLSDARLSEKVLTYGVASIFALIAASFLSWVAYDNLRNFIAERSLGPVDLQVFPMETFCGEQISFSLEFTPRRDVRIQQIYAELHCQEITKIRSTSRRRGSSTSSTSTSSKKNSVHHVDFPLQTEPAEHRSGETFAAAEILHIPEDVRSSLYWRCPWWIRMLPLPMMLLSIERMWVVEVHIEADGAPDWMSRFKFLVYP